MSMFHELMMRKKEETMYATIKGTLTESPEGVFSGFSASNYLKGQGLCDFSKPFEIKTSFILNSSAEGSSADNYLYNTSSGRYFVLAVNPSRYLKARYGNGTSWTECVFNYRCSIGVKYYTKHIYTGTTFDVYISTDDVNYTLVDSRAISQIYPSNEQIVMGLLVINNSVIGGVFNGSIDLNNSYIKLGSTKYNLQAVVGYTVVGSPSIVDGVVSGFSASDYLKIDRTITADNIEISVPFSLSAKGWNDIFWGDTSSQTKLLAETNPSGSLNLYFTQGISGNIFITNYAVDTQYRLNFVVTYDTFSYKLINEDTNTIVKEETIERTTKASPYLNISAFGRSAPNTTIPIKDSWIKIDGKLWFNGQQA